MNTPIDGKFELIEIGVVENDFTDDIPKDYNDKNSKIVIHQDHVEALLGIEGHSHVVVVSWLHKSDRTIRQLHPMRNPENPLTGVFATRSPVRPNPIGITVCELIERNDNILTVKGLDFLDGTPVIDIKSYSKHMKAENPKYPDWISK